ncbi:MAG: hypothetical protein AB7F86_19070 [Bdellovibrionales bacterium]
MFKSLKAHKQVWLGLMILMVGFEVGLWFGKSEINLDQKSISSVKEISKTADARGPCVVDKSEPPAEPKSEATQTTESSSLAVEPKEEILGSPIFKDPGVLKSTVHGWIHVRWKAVNGAKAYEVHVKDYTGKEIRNFTTYRTYTYLKKLPVDPRQDSTLYSVIVTPLGEGEARGKPSDEKAVAMRPLRNLEPPTIKAIHTQKEEDPGSNENIPTIKE